MCLFSYALLFALFVWLLGCVYVCLVVCVWALCVCFVFDCVSICLLACVFVYFVKKVCCLCVSLHVR